MTLLEQVRLDVGLVSRDPISSDPNAFDIGERGDSGYKPSKKRHKKADRKSDKADKLDKADKKDKKKKKKLKKSHRMRADEKHPETSDTKV